MSERFNQLNHYFLSHFQHQTFHRQIKEIQPLVKQEEIQSQELYVKYQPSSAKQQPAINSLPSYLKQQQFEGYIHVKHQLDQAENPTDAIPVQHTPKPFLSKFKMEQHRKNSNVIKKYGRIILKFGHKFQLTDQKNEGFEMMMNDLNSRLNSKPKSKDLSDFFSTKNLHMLFKNNSPTVTAFNRRTISRLLAQKMRKEILDSKQIRDGNSLIYLNTLKCLQMRLCNQRLALRLELPKQTQQ